MAKRLGLYLMFVAVGLALLALAVEMSSAANVTMSVTVSQGHIVDEEPEYFYLFNKTTRKYEDIIQFEYDKSKGEVLVRMRAANLTIITYKFLDKSWPAVYVNDTLTVVSSLNLTDLSNIKKVKFDLGKWSFTDHGETIDIYREIATKDESINETWTFYFKLGKSPKITWDIFDLDKKADENRSLEWKVKIQDAYYKLKAKTKANATLTTFKVKDLNIDFVDFGTSHVQVEANTTTKEYIVTFYPGGMGGNYTIDPTLGFTPTVMNDVCWIYLAFVNPQNPTDPTEPTRYDDLHIVWIEVTTPAVEIPVDSNPFPVDSAINAQVKVYDNWGRFWSSPYIATGSPGTYTRLDGVIPICWISVQCWNGIRNDGFHRWAIKTSGGPTWFYVDEPRQFPVIVDDANQVSWSVWVPPDIWISDGGIQTVTHGDLSGRREYVVNFDVDLLTEPSTVYIRLYDASTGEGIPWDRFITRWDSTITPTNVIQIWTAETHTIEIEDFWGNELYISVITGGSWDAPIHLWKIPITTYSVKMFNQNPQFIHKLQVYYNLVDGPYVEYIAPLEVIELHLKAADYRFKWTPYKNYVAQETQQFDLTVDSANYFLIDGVTISRVVSDIEGIYALQQVITTFVTPDLVAIATELPRVPCKDQFGEVRFIHPWAVVTATVSYSISDQSSALLWEPHRASALSNYTTVRDVLYLSGAYGTDVTIKWTGNDTTRFTFTELPPFVDLGDCGNYTISSSAAITLTRETTWRESTRFYWAYYVSEHKYVYSAPINNSMNLTWTDVNFMVGWAENRSMDLSGVRVYDIQNDIHLTNGENYDLTSGGVYFYFVNLSAGSLRTFTITAWDANTTGVYDTPAITCTEYATEAYKGKSLYYCLGSWTNSNPVSYTGAIIISFKWEKDVNEESIIVWDRNRNRQLGDAEWTWLGGGVMVHSQGVGTIGVGSTASFKVYFRLSADEEETRGMFGVKYFGLSAWMWFVFLALGFSGAAYAADRKGKVKGVTREAWILGAIVLWSAVTVAYILNSMGVII